MSFPIHHWLLLILAFAGTSAWFFLIVNCAKIPFSANLGLISPASLWVDVVLLPGVAAGLWAGRRLVAVVPQKVFEALVLILAVLASLRLIS